LIQGAQVLVAAALVMGIALEFRGSRFAWTWNVAAQIAAAMFPCAVFLLIMHTANRNGERIDGIEAVLMLYGFWIFAACGVTWFLYSRNNRSFAQATERR
jgi:ABC-type nickel/cobalt efflux system permease component RcnA